MYLTIKINIVSYSVNDFLLKDMPFLEVFKYFPFRSSNERKSLLNLQSIPDIKKKWVRKKTKTERHKDHIWKLNMTFSTFRSGTQDRFTFRVRQDLEQPALTRQPKIIDQWYENLSYSVKGPLRGSEIISTCSLIMDSCLKRAPDWEAIRSVALTLRSESRATSELWQLTRGE